MKMSLSSIKINFNYIIIALLFGCIMLSGLISQPVQAIMFVGLLCLLFFTDYFYLAYPIVLFYYSSLGMIFGVSVYRIFSLMFILKIVISKFNHDNYNNNFLKIGIDNSQNNQTENLVTTSNYYNNYSYKSKQNKNKYKYVLVFMVYLLYEIIVMMTFNMRVAMFSIVDVVCVILFITQILSNTEKFKNTFMVFGITAIIAFFSGIIINNDISNWQSINGELVKITRFMSTFNDPNYMGLFYSVTIFAIISLKLFSKKLRVVMVISLYIMLMTTISMTAIIGNIVFWMVFLLITKKINIKTAICIALVGVVLGGIYQYGSQNKDTPILGDLVYRIEDKITNIKDNDTDALTTDRSKITKEHWDYYWSQSLPNILFGGNKMNSYVSEINGQKAFAAHNEYVDLLLNVGLIGTIILIGFVVLTLLKSLKEYIKTKSEKALCIFMIKVIWLYYAATLTMFLEFRFMIFYFI